MLRVRKGLIGYCTVEIVDVPVFDSVNPGWKPLNEHRAVFRFFHRDDVIGSLEFLFSDLQGVSVGTVGLDIPPCRAN